MANITMCSGKNCDKKEFCYRYTAPRNEYRQAIFTETPWVDHRGIQVCDKYYPNTINKKK